jgi:type I restriction enzyme S subunit
MSSEVKALGEICQIKQGKYLSPGEMSEVPTPEKSIPVVGGNGVLGYTDRPSHTTDVALITCRGSKCGLIQWAKAPVWVSNNAMACDTGTLLGNRFLRYLFGSTGFEDVVTGSAQPQITVGHLSKKEFSVCSESEWPHIVETLGTLDDRITLLRETNTTLEAIAQALFKSWFVDFDPVHAKMQGRAPEGMNEATAALFPDSFEDSEQGPVPKGWHVRPVGDAVETVGGATPDTKTPEYWEPADHHWTTPKDLSGIASPVLLSTERKLSDAGLKKISSGLLPVGSLLMSSRAPIGYLALTQVPMAINQGYIAIPPGGKLSPLFMLFWCQTNMDNIKGRANGSTFMEISKKAFRPIPAVVPSQAVLDAFEAVAFHLFARLIENEKQAQGLGSIRDVLLPRLISGQLQPSLMEVDDGS